MKKLFCLMMVAILVAICLPATAAGPSDPPPTAPGSPTTSVKRSGFGGTSETTITGMVVNSKGRPLLDVMVKLYMGGLLVEEQPTSSDGSFEFTELIDYGIDVTIDLWFVPPTDDLVMENVILKESSAARQYGLYSDCVQRERLDPITDMVVRLYDLDTRLDVLKRMGCIE